MGEVVSTIPMIGFNVETVQYNNIKFQVWDLGGQTSIRPYWRCYFPNTQAIIYVVHSSDTDRIGIAKEEFHAILEVFLCLNWLVVFAYRDKKQGVTQAIIHSAINFMREPWPKVSDNAKDLVKKCLILVQSSILQYRKCLGPGVGISSDLPPAGAIADSQLGMFYFSCS
ncbi:uncharacterized protein LOC108488317 [Gossypium arboreum]|uniref:ADP-ribosylation factor-like protein 1 n=1 Tax=Gossypium arboreum TaxID=29729 RepID=A0ABR0NCE4_GOSAR|nr:uncharacterized protein LOC108488317 [Gossypium arboreum]KAK5792672.1 hypothetical protein PVK06_033787 [Gossypium arboreum]